MPTNFQRLKSGQAWAVTETTANAIIAAAEQFAKHAHDPASLDPSEFVFEGNVIAARNDAGNDLPAFAVVGIATAAINPSQNLNAFQTVVEVSLRVPTAADSGAFGITLEPIACGLRGKVLISGVAPVVLYPPVAAPGFCDCIPGQINYLQPGSGNARVLYCDVNSGWAYVRLPDGGGSAGSPGSSSGSGTTTTTTPIPCGGVCSMTWSAANQKWSITSNSCNAGTTTTTSTTTTTTSTTTTAVPARCLTTTTAAPTTTTTSTTPGGATTTTTTTPAPCQCQYPWWCGSKDGEVTVVPCSSRYSQPPICGNTTTTPNPSCTTTTPAGGCGQCLWCGNAAGTWQQTAVCASPACICLPPSGSPTGCTSASTPCLVAPPVVVQCNGQCQWVWEKGDGGAGCGPINTGFWSLLFNVCSTGDCSCDPPPSPGSNCGDQVTTGCSPRNPNPCTSTTTTTPAPCNQQCQWQWNSTTTAWANLSYPCPPNCPCSAPTYNGTTNGQTAWTYCAVTTSTTTTTTTTTSTTTTTPSPMCVNYSNTYECWGGTSPVNWFLASANNCPGACQTCTPTIPCFASSATPVTVSQPCISNLQSCPTTTSTTPNPCNQFGGWCQYQSQAVTNTQGQVIGTQWVLLSTRGCYFQSSCLCGCLPPNYAAPPLQNGSGTIVSVGCSCQ